jgi:hypothetical protein
MPGAIVAPRTTEIFRPENGGIGAANSSFSALARVGRCMRQARMTDPDDIPPDRLSNDPRSPYFNAEALARDVGIRFKGAEKTNVEEYCVSEGWVRVAAGKALDRHGNPLTIKLTGTVEPYFKNKRPE